MVFVPPPPLQTEWGEQFTPKLKNTTKIKRRAFRPVFLTFGGAFRQVEYRPHRNSNGYCSPDLLGKHNGGNKFGAQTAGRHGGGYGRRHWIYIYIHIHIIVMAPMSQVILIYLLYLALRLKLGKASESSDTNANANNAFLFFYVFFITIFICMNNIMTIRSNISINFNTNV